MLLVSSVGGPYRKDVMYRLYFLNAVIPYFKWSFAINFSVSPDVLTNGLFLS